MGLNENIENANHPLLTKSVLWLMTISACMVVANNYYAQPLLGDIAREFNVSESRANQVATITVFGYAIGLFLIVPLGDMYQKKRLIVYDFIIIIASLLCFALSTNIIVMTISAFFIGLSSVVPQMFVPLAAQLSKPEERSLNVGIVMSGLLVGILGSRVFSGFIGAYMGWRSVYFIAAILMLILWIAIIYLLPNVKPTFLGSYKGLITSMFKLAKQRSDLRLAGLRGALAFASFQVFWTTLTFYLEKPPFSAGSDIAGLIGIVGIGGAIMAGYVGRIADKINKNHIIMVAILLMIFSWPFIGATSLKYIGLVIGIFMLDIGLQSVHVTNQSIVFSKDENATNRINTIYMTCYFIGGTLGAFLGGKAWENYGWNGVVFTGVIFLIILFIVHCLGSKRQVS